MLVGTVGFSGKNSACKHVYEYLYFWLHLVSGVFDVFFVTDMKAEINNKM